jgi:hypothetical protein
MDAFLAIVTPGGDTLSLCGYIGGSGSDEAYDIAVDSIGGAYVTGTTESSDFPLKLALDSRPAHWEAFLVKVTWTGTDLAFSSYLGGSDGDFGQRIALDNSGNVYVAGYTFSFDLPVAAGPDWTHNGDLDAFVAKIAGLREAW